MTAMEYNCGLGGHQVRFGRKPNCPPIIGRRHGSAASLTRSSSGTCQARARSASLKLFHNLPYALLPDALSIYLTRLFVDDRVSQPF